MSFGVFSGRTFLCFWIDNAGFGLCSQNTLATFGVAAVVFKRPVLDILTRTALALAGFAEALITPFDRC